MFSSFLLGLRKVEVFIPQISSNLVITLHTYLPMKMEQTECSETSAYKIQTPGNYPEENIKHSQHGESLKSKMLINLLEPSGVPQGLTLPNFALHPNRVMYVLCGSQVKQQLFSCITLIDWPLYTRLCVYCAVCTEYLNIIEVFSWSLKGQTFFAWLLPFL
jgi:hypothetical protein